MYLRELVAFDQAPCALPESHSEFPSSSNITGVLAWSEKEQAVRVRVRIEGLSVSGHIDLKA